MYILKENYMNKIGFLLKMNASGIWKRLFLGATVTTAAYWTPLLHHTVFLDKYRKIVARCCLDKELPVDRKLHQLFEQVMNDLKLSDEFRKRLQLFSMFSFDMFHAGTFTSKYGALVGIPINFEHTDISTVDKEDILIEDEPIDWSCDDANLFIHSTVISEDAKKFAMAREVLRLQTNEPYLKAYGSASIVMLLYTSYNIISYKYRLCEARPIFRRTIMAGFILFGIGCWLAYKDHYSYKYDMENDMKLSEMGPAYIRGGEEYYRKLLERNIGLRGLLGRFGEYSYSPNGNEYYFLSVKNMPLSHRKNYFHIKLQEIEQI